MIDNIGRKIEYLRISITDRCNLRCSYCMPQGCESIEHEEVLRFEEFLKLAELFARVGIKYVRVTGGEPMVRKGAVDFIADLKKVPGIEAVSMTTNGVLLAKYADELKKAGLDSVNISLDTPCPELADKITGCKGIVQSVNEGIAAMRERGITVKLNAVLLKETAHTLTDLTKYAEVGIPLRFIELMPMGCGNPLEGISAKEALGMLQEKYPDLHSVDANLGSGPAHYYESAALKAPIGMIDAVSHRFCESCNRVRLTSTGVLKPCLCFDQHVDLKALLRGGASEEELLDAIRKGIFSKPRQHCFDEIKDRTENKLMSQIGG